MRVCHRIILVVFECRWNSSVFLLDLPSFDDTSSLGYPSLWVVYPLGSMVPPSHFRAENREAELKSIIFSLLLLFRVFLYFLFSEPPRNTAPLSAACWGYYLVIIRYPSLFYLHFRPNLIFLSYHVEGYVYHVGGNLLFTYTRWRH